MVGAKHPHQRTLAESLGADTVVAPDQLARAVRRRSGSLVLAGRLTDGADVVFDCVGTSESLTHALAMVRPRGRVVLVGMPGRVSLDLAPLWHRGAHRGRRLRLRDRVVRARPAETRTQLRAGHRPGRPRPGSARWSRPRYPLERYEEAIGHAGAAGRRGAVKVVFDLRKPKGSTR